MAKYIAVLVICAATASNHLQKLKVFEVPATKALYTEKVLSSFIDIHRAMLVQEIYSTRSDRMTRDRCSEYQGS